MRYAQSRSYSHWPRVFLLILTSLSVGHFAEAQSGLGRPQSAFLQWGIFAGLLVLLWVVLYRGLYPYLLYFYSPGYSKTLFWALLFLYGLGWIHLSMYAIFDVGYYFPWLRYVVAFLMTMWLLSMIVLVGRRRGTQ